MVKWFKIVTVENNVPINPFSTWAGQLLKVDVETIGAFAKYINTSRSVTTLCQFMVIKRSVHSSDYV